ncbi:MAG: hypothetical protein IJA77_00160 [Clostridia bacterium]|nr:hypothetical protein [Clostridia bacterium]
MFETQYRQMNDGIHANEALIQRTMKAAVQPKPRRHLRAAPLLALAVGLIVILVLPVLALRDNPPDVTSENITPQTAGSFTPVGHMTEVDGMTLRYLTSYSMEGSTFVLLSLTGAEVSEEMVLNFAMTSEKTGQTFLAAATPLDYNRELQRMTLMLAIHDRDLPGYLPLERHKDGTWDFVSEAYDPSAFTAIPADDRLTLSLMSYQHILYQPLDYLTLEDLTTALPSCWIDAESLDIPTLDASDMDVKLQFSEQVLSDVEPLCRPVEGFNLLHARRTSEQLIVSTQIDTAYAPANPESRTTLYAWLYLIPREMMTRPWTTLGLYEGVKTHALLTGDAENSASAIYFFPLTEEEADNYMLCLYGFYEIDLNGRGGVLTFTLGK